MRSEEFWSLSWYEWGLWILKIHNDNRRRSEDHELTIEMTRSFMALFANANRTKDAEIFKPQDFFKLSYDDKEDQGRKELTEEEKKEFFERAKKQFRRG